MLLLYLWIRCCGLQPSHSTLIAWQYTLPMTYSFLSPTADLAYTNLPKALQSTIMALLMYLIHCGNILLLLLCRDPEKWDMSFWFDLLIFSRSEIGLTSKIWVPLRALDDTRAGFLIFIEQHCCVHPGNDMKSGWLCATLAMAWDMREFMWCI